MVSTQFAIAKHYSRNKSARTPSTALSMAIYAPLGFSFPFAASCIGGLGPGAILLLYRFRLWLSNKDWIPFLSLISRALHSSKFWHCSARLSHAIPKANVLCFFWPPIRFPTFLSLPVTSLLGIALAWLILIFPFVPIARLTRWFPLAPYPSRVALNLQYPFLPALSLILPSHDSFFLLPDRSSPLLIL